MASTNNNNPPARYSKVSRRRCAPSSEPSWVPPARALGLPGTLTISLVDRGPNGRRGLKLSGSVVFVVDARAWASSAPKVPASARGGAGKGGGGGGVPPGGKCAHGWAGPDPA